MSETKVKKSGRYFVQEFPDRQVPYSVIYKDDDEELELGNFYDRAEADEDAAFRNKRNAAEAMYHALKATMPILNYVDRNGGCEELLKEVSAAIAKAEGQ